MNTIAPGARGGGRLLFHPARRSESPVERSIHPCHFFHTIFNCTLMPVGGVSLERRTVRQPKCRIGYIRE